MTIYTVKYQIATYEGTVDVFVQDDADSEHIIARAKRQLRQRCGGSLPFGSESWRVVAQREESDAA